MSDQSASNSIVDHETSRKETSRPVMGYGRLVIRGGIVLVTIGAFALTSKSQEDPTRPPSTESRPTPAVIGSANCSSCHAPPNKYSKESLICEMNQYPTWKEKDRHQIAYQVLLGERSKEIGDRLGLDVTSPQNSCVHCHGVITPPEVKPFQFDAKEDGVTCIVCHGGAEEWITQHQIPNSPRWRSLTRAEKRDQKGMRDLWDPKTRVETCFSCHIGEPGENKVLTHEMYAAGHPPLPSIEISSFSEEQPRHWQYLREKPESIQKILGFNPARLEQTELVAVSGLMALRSTIRQLVDPSMSSQSEQPFRPDYARYDCAACHHDLKTWDLSWRQAREESHKPGRPSPPAWPRALVRLGLEAADPSRAENWYQELIAKMDRFDAVMTERPFGNQEKARPIAQEVIDLLDQPIDALRDQTKLRPGQPGRIINRTEAIRLIQKLGPICNDLVHDYESARQIAWAFRTMYHEVEPDPSNRDPNVARLLEELNQKLGLSLNPNRMTERKPVLDSLGSRLKAIRDYDPSKFRVDINQLVEKVVRQK